MNTLFNVLTASNSVSSLVEQASLILGKPIMLCNNAFHIIAVDMPSDQDANTRKLLGTAVHAHKTVTFHRMKQGLDLAPRVSGDVTVVHIGIPA